MALPLQLNTTTSIVDYLKSVNKPSSFSAREGLYKEKGLESRLGTYTGSTAQNTAFLKLLQSESKPAAPVAGPVPSGYSESAFRSTGALSTITQPKTSTNYAASPFLSSGYQEGDVVPGLGRITPEGGFAPVFTSQDEELKKKQAAATAAAGTAPVTTPVSPTTGETPASGFLQDFGIPGIPSQEDLVNQAFESPLFKLFQERTQFKTTVDQAKAEADKADLERKYASDKAKLEQNLGQRGLFMSGIRQEQVQQLTEELAASKLGVDRELASKLMEANYDIRQRVLDDVSKLIDDAKKGQQDAVGQLNKVGLAVLPNGAVVPTLEALRYQREGETQAFQQRMQMAQFEQRLNEFDALQENRTISNNIASERLKISAQNAITQQERNAILQQLNYVNLLNKTAVAPGQIVNAASGLPVKLDDAQRIRYAGYDNFLNYYIPTTINSLQNVETGGPYGWYVMYAYDKPYLQNILTEPQQKFMDNVTQMNSALIYLLSGKQINEHEYERLKIFLPSFLKNNEQNSTDLREFDNLMSSIYLRELKASGLTIASKLNTQPFTPPPSASTFEANGVMYHLNEDGTAEEVSE